MADSPAAVLVDGVNGVELAVEGGTAIPANTRAVLVAGQEGSNARIVLVDASGRVTATIGTAIPAGSNKIGSVQIRNPGDSANLGDLANPVRVDPTGATTQPISASALPLPAGAATAANQATIIGHVDGIEGLLTTIHSVLDSINAKDFATETTIAAQLDITQSALRDAIAGGSPNTSTLYELKQTLDSINAKDFATETTLAAAKAVLDTIDSVLDSIKDTDGIKKITDALPVGDNVIGRTKITDGTQVATLTDDAGIIRQEVLGKVSIVGALPPPATSPFKIFADTPRTVGTHDTTFVIPDGEVCHLQNVICGNEDPTKGAIIEVIYDDGSEHLIDIVYTAGFSVSLSFADVDTSRDGTSLVGNVGGTNVIIVRRMKFSGSDIAIDAVVTGYTV